MDYSGQFRGSSRSEFHPKQHKEHRKDSCKLACLLWGDLQGFRNLRLHLDYHDRRMLSCMGIVHMGTLGSIGTWLCNHACRPWIFVSRFCNSIQLLGYNALYRQLKQLEFLKGFDNQLSPGTGRSVFPP